jgi:hypothetical protein
VDRSKWVRELGWGKITSLFSLTSNLNLAFPSIRNVGIKQQTTILLSVPVTFSSIEITDMQVKRNKDREDP